VANKHTYIALKENEVRQHHIGALCGQMNTTCSTGALGAGRPTASDVNATLCNLDRATDFTRSIKPQK